MLRNLTVDDEMVLRETVFHMMMKSILVSELTICCTVMVRGDSCHMVMERDSFSIGQ